MAPDGDAIAFPFVSADIRRAAEATGVGTDTIRDAVADGSLVAHYAGAKASKPLFRAVELDAWVSSLPTRKGDPT